MGASKKRSKRGTHRRTASIVQEEGTSAAAPRPIYPELHERIDASQRHCRYLAMYLAETWSEGELSDLQANAYCTLVSLVAELGHLGEAALDVKLREERERANGVPSSAVAP